VEFVILAGLVVGAVSADLVGYVPAPATKEFLVEALKNNPVRIYSIAVAALALVAFYLPGLPVALILGLVAAILGVGEGVRAAVTPNRRVVVSQADLDEVEEFEA
jgi:predicted branched-subunit amino acid permease